MEGISKADLASEVAVYFLRLVQLTNVAISCFAVCYLVYMHNHHPCKYQPYYCESRGVYGNQQVPLSEVLMIVTCVLVALEFVYSTGSTLLRLRLNKRPDSFASLCSAWTGVGLFSVGLLAFASQGDVRQTWPWCYGVWFDSKWGSVEKNFCIVTQSAVTCGLIAWIASLIIGVLAVREFRKDHGSGGISLGSTAQSGTSDVAIDVLEA